MKNDDQKKFESVFKKLGANDTQKNTVKDKDIHKSKTDSGFGSKSVAEKGGATVRGNLKDNSRNSLTKNKNETFVRNKFADDNSRSGRVLSTKSTQPEVLSVDRAVEKVIEVPVEKIVEVEK